MFLIVTAIVRGEVEAFKAAVDDASAPSIIATMQGPLGLVLVLPACLIFQLA